MPRSWLTFPHRDSPIHFRARVLGGLGGRDQVKEQPRVGDAPYREATWGAWLQTPQAIFRASIWWVPCYSLGFPGDPDDKESSCNVEDLGLIPGLGRSPGGEHSNPLQCSCLMNIPLTEEPSRLQSIESKESNTTEATEHTYINTCESESGSVVCNSL